MIKIQSKIQYFNPVLTRDHARLDEELESIRARVAASVVRRQLEAVILGAGGGPC